MRYLFLYIALFLSAANVAYGQCYPERHNTAWYNGWMSCEISANPNATRPESHWIMYDFGNVLEMYNFSVWNVNAPEFLDHGIQTAHIDYSLDGETWLEYGEVSLAQGTGENTYEGQELFNFNGVEAKYLLITAATTYGSDCAGLAEIKLEVDSSETIVPTDTTTQTAQDSICIIADVFPNPMVTNELFITLKQQCVPAVHYTVTDATGKIVVQSTPIAL
ncbi:MAG: discoidin domain-containing protein, partial [Crocinitomicaceae bacterium]